MPITYGSTGQVHDQAREAAIGRLDRLFKDQLENMKVIGPVKVEAITTDLERRYPPLFHLPACR